LIKGKDFSNKLNNFIELKDEIKTKTAEQKLIDNYIKEIGLDAYIDLYNNIKYNPETIKLQSDDGKKIMFLAMKKYSGTIDDEKAEELRKKYGDDFVIEKSEVIMNNDILEKHSDKLEELIMNADFMTIDEKNDLFINKITYNIKPDALDDAFIIANGKVKELISDISPVLMLKETK
jgi:hypothetical protein